MSAGSFKTSQLSRTDGTGILQNEEVTIYGRVKSKRKSGSSLGFLDLESGEGCGQCVLNFKIITDRSKASSQLRWNSGWSQPRLGDWLAVKGVPYRTPAGEFSLLATELPQLYSPNLQPFSTEVTNPETRSRNRHAERIAHPSARDPIILRHKLFKTLRQFFFDRNFVEVSTPLLMANAGGAAARPFETRATEFADMTLAFRIAPELFLKRLTVGNMDKIFEIGPAFRNEGVDSTHNPEFTICEFYQMFADLPQLISMTEDIFTNMARTAKDSRSALESVPEPNEILLNGHYTQVQFIPALESAVQKAIPNWRLPELTSPDGYRSLKETCSELSLAGAGSISGMLDQLSSSFLEPTFEEPTWLVHHPACMAPLAKSFFPEASNISVAARAELFIGGREYVNCYEEENSPFEQRQKFEQQLYTQTSSPNDDAPSNRYQSESIDENYINVMEWGMPPTGGWGCGLDRLVMLFAGKHRIADVLPFGTLTNVVGLGNQSRKKKE
ncbi:MAG: hypothetical protein M1831_001851 [Alyxoria varia]|nr:MAG: hypothetical protein M1831_001851 [Alyxoria varia]